MFEFVVKDLVYVVDCLEFGFRIYLLGYFCGGVYCWVVVCYILECIVGIVMWVFVGNYLWKVCVGFIISFVY